MDAKTTPQGVTIARDFTAVLPERTQPYNGGVSGKHVVGALAGSLMCVALPIILWRFSSG